MRKTVITTIILAFLAFCFFWWKIYENLIFSIIGSITLVAGIIAIYEFLKKGGGNPLKKQLKDKDKQIQGLQKQIENTNELREYDKEKIEKLEKEKETLIFRNIGNENDKQIRETETEIRQAKKELNDKDAKIAILYKEMHEILREKIKLEKQLEEKEEIIKQYEEKYAETQSPLYKKAYKLFRDGDTEKALSVLKVEDLEKYNDIDLWLFRAKLLETIGNYDEVIKCYKKIIIIKPECTETCSNMGIAHYKMGNFNEAIKCYEKITKTNPEHAETYNNMGIAYYKIGNFNEAIKCYERAIKIKPDYAEAHNNMGIAYYKIGNFNEAIKCYERAIKIKPDYAEAYNNMGIAYYKIPKYDEAIKCYKKAIDLKPDYAEAYCNLGKTYIRTGGESRNHDEPIKHYKSIKCFEKAIDLEPDYAAAYYHLGFTYCCEAVVFYLTKDNYKDYFGKNTYGKNTYGREFYGKAIKYYDKAIELKYDDVPVEDYWYWGWAFHDTGNYYKEIECYEKDIKSIHDTSAAVYHDLGNAYCKIGKYKKGIEAYKDTIKKSPNSKEAYFDMGNAYLEIGEYKKAIESYEKAIELDPDYTMAYHNMKLAYQYFGDEYAANACSEKTYKFGSNNSITEE